MTSKQGTPNLDRSLYTAGPHFSSLTLSNPPLSSPSTTNITNDWHYFLNSPKNTIMIIDTVIWGDSHSLLDMGWVKDSGLPLARLELELLLWDQEKGSLSSLFQPLSHLWSRRPLRGKAHRSGAAPKRY